MIVENYIKQHNSIRAEVNKINDLIKRDSVADNAFNIAKEINHLAGIIKVHLSTEDKFLYPRLEASEDLKVRRMSMDYQREMGNLIDVFTEFCVKYNTKTKVIEKSVSFKGEFKVIVQQLEKRMDKEEKGIYLFAKNI